MDVPHDYDVYIDKGVSALTFLFHQSIHLGLGHREKQRSLPSYYISTPHRALPYRLILPCLPW